MIQSASAITSRLCSITTDRVARIDQAMQNVDELLDIGHVQPDSGFVEDIQCPAHRCERARSLLHRLRDDHGVSRLREFRDQFDALGFATRERRALLTEGEITKPDILQQTKTMMYRAMSGEKLDGLVHVHRQNLADRAVP